MRIRTLLTTSSILLAGCVSAPVENSVTTCGHADWYELGRLDGSQGTPTDRLNEHQKDCVKKINPDWETIYTNGRNAGLLEYCDLKNAFELGRTGASYHYVCPSTVEQEFLSSYRKGQEARELEAENKKLEEQTRN